MDSSKSTRSTLELPQPKLQVPSGLPQHPSPHVRSTMWSPSSTTSTTSTSSPFSPFSPKAPKLTTKRPKPLKLDNSNKPCTCGGRGSPKQNRSSGIAQLGQTLKKMRTCFRHTPNATPTAEAKPVNNEKKKAQKTKKKKKKTKTEYDYEDIGDHHWADDF